METETISIHQRDLNLIHLLKYQSVYIIINLSSMILFQTHLVKFNHKIAGQERSKGQGKHAHINEKKCRVISL